jgi:hypothetical protein
MIIIANGYKLPQLDDDGATFFPAIEFDIVRLAGHKHDGVDSSIIPAISQDIPAANWVATSGQPGTYEQVVTMTSPLLYDTTSIEMRLADGSRVFAAISRQSANSYKVFTNDNTLTYLAVYSS